MLVPAAARCVVVLAAAGGWWLPTGASGESRTGSGLRVAVDVGHSQARPGARSATGKSEHDFNRRFAEELVARSESWRDLTLFMLTGAKLSLRDRPDQAAQKGADLFLSIHHDSVSRKYIQHWEHAGQRLAYSDAFKGYSLFVWEDGAHAKESLAAATLIGKSLRRAHFSPTLHHAEPIAGENRKLLDRELGIYAAPFAVLRLASIPAVLFEVGIIVNREEERALDDAKVRAKIQLQLLKALRTFSRERGARQKSAAP
jgi:N-acetylmuramoyl-L-alanine amidase